LLNFTNQQTKRFAQHAKHPAQKAERHNKARGSNDGSCSLNHREMPESMGSPGKPVPGSNSNVD